MEVSETFSCLTSTQICNCMWCIPSYNYVVTYYFFSASFISNNKLSYVSGTDIQMPPIRPSYLDPSLLKNGIPQISCIINVQGSTVPTWCSSQGPKCVCSKYPPPPPPPPSILNVKFYRWSMRKWLFRARRDLRNQWNWWRLLLWPVPYLSFLFLIPLLLWCSSYI